MIKVYGADWCGDTQQAKRYLDSLGINYQYINVEENAEASEWVKSQNGGKEKKPTIKINDRVLKVPSQNELNSALKQEGIIS